jgi:hypothetical protein
MKLAAAIAALALLVTACGGDEGGGGGTDPAALLTAAVAKTDETTSTRMKFDMRITFGGQDVRSSGEMRAGIGKTRAAGAMDMSIDGRELSADVILLDGASYMRSAELDLPAGKSWLRSEDEQLKQQTMSLQQFVDLVRDASGAREVGREDVRGRPTVHITAPLDMAELAERTPDGPVVKMFEDQPELAERLQAQVDIWIGEADERIERIKLEMSVEGEPGQITMTADVLEYDVDIDDIEAPPRDEVVDASGG